MKRKKISCLLLAMSLVTAICANFTPVNAAQTQGGVSETSVQVAVDSGFTVDPTDLSEILITIPSNLNLEYNESNLTYSVSDCVTAKGKLADNRVLSVSVSPRITYSNSKDAEYKVDVPVSYKRVANGVHYWTAAELAANAQEGAAADDRTISISKQAGELMKDGDYDSHVEFSIDVLDILNLDDTTDFTFDTSTNTLQPVYSSIVNSLYNGTFKIPAYVKKDGVFYPVKNFLYNNTTIGSSYSNGITNVILPEGIVTIGDGLFCDFTNLSSVTLPDSLEKIRHTTFRDCTALEYINIPSGVKEIAAYAFFNTGLRNIDLSKLDLSNSDYFSTNSNAGDGAEFMNCTSLETVILPDTAKRIPVKCFDNCINLREITLCCNKIVASFGNCSSLTKVNYHAPKSVFKGIYGLSYILPSNTGAPSLTVICTDGTLEYDSTGTLVSET